jgi:alkanesulfonate monooxygenase SsuD/methylene tetrahydromethanopterin reductase-like flavin-dependent oxidoreductase (luciferase family)
MKSLATMLQAFKAEVTRRTERFFAGSETSLAESEREARAFAKRFCAGGIGDYKLDESSIARYDGLRYCKERQTWMAHFVPAPGQKSALKHSDSTYTEVLALARLFNDNRIKPSECVRALTDFEIKYDHEAAKFRFPEPQ